MERKLKIYSEVIYNNDQTDTKLISDRCFTVGDIYSINDCINKTIEEVSRCYLGISSAAAFFGITCATKSFTIIVAGINDEIIEDLTVNNLEEVTKFTTLVKSMCE